VARSVAPGMVARTKFTGGGVIDGEAAQWRRGGGAPTAGSSHFGLRWLGELLQLRARERDVRGGSN
jgi:hypothetical protein